MDDNRCYLAVDLGATSGRTIVGRMTNGKVELEELTRFENPIIHVARHDYWDILALYNEIIKGLKAAAQRHFDIGSIGIDTWGCDVALFADGQLISSPFSYRDPQTVGMPQQYFASVMSREQVYGKTGIEVMNFNTIFQLYRMRQDQNATLALADKILFMPDALGYMLTGEAVCEYTIASTSQMINPATKDFDEDILRSLYISRSQFGKMVMPGTPIGTLTEDVQRLTGLGAVPVVAVAGHDTASAIAAVPAGDGKFAFLSSGTWSLLGIELEQPVINSRSLELNFTNEGGVDGTTCFLKNICGLWIYESCRREWAAADKASGQTNPDIDHVRLIHEAAVAAPFRTIINPDDPVFANPASMTEAVRIYCERTGQPVPRTRGEYCRCFFESLALRYRQVLEWLRELAGFDILTLHVIGGGSRNSLLNQMTADCCQVRVLAGPQECTALGNILLQARNDGRLDDRRAMRRVVAASSELHEFMPAADAAAWNQAYDRFLGYISMAEKK